MRFSASELKRRAAASGLLLSLLFGLSCKDDPAVLRVEIGSDLRIPDEANLLEVRILEQDVILESGSFRLGQPPLDTWPQVLPIVRGKSHGPSVTLIAELRIQVGTQPALVVGHGETTAVFPSKGELTIPLSVSRSCIDLDLDGYGVGFGCQLVDCDDENQQAPSPRYFDCPGLVASDDAGVSEDRPVLDSDSGSPPDINAPDVGFGQDAAFAPDSSPGMDRGFTWDFGVGPGSRDSSASETTEGQDAGVFDSGVLSMPCGSTECFEGEVCLSPGQCARACTRNTDCGGNEYCLLPPGGCLCRFCRDDLMCSALGVLVCDRGCCTFD